MPWSTETKAVRIDCEMDDHGDDKINALCTDGWRVKQVISHPGVHYQTEHLLVIFERDVIVNE